MKSPTETALVKQCLQWLSLQPGILCWRNNSGGLPMAKKGKNYWVSFGAKGSPDIVGSLYGKFIGIECKMPEGRLSEEQAAFIDSLRSTGALAFVVRSLDELIHVIELEKACR